MAPNIPAFKFQTLLANILLVVICLQHCTTRNENTSAEQLTDSLASALNDKDFFLARDLYAQYQSNMPEFDRLLFQAELMAAFNQPDSSNKALECLLNDHKAQLTDSLLIAATEMQ